MPKKKTLKELQEEAEHLKAQIAKKRQRLEALKKKVREEYRKREASFLIGIGRTLLKHGEILTNHKGQRFLCIPIDAEGMREAFSKYRDIVEANKDFEKWLKYFND